MYDEVDESQQQEEALPQEAEPLTPPPPARQSMFADPVVRRLAFAAAVVVMLFLATVIGVLSSGMLAPTGPRTLTEQQLAVTRAAVSQGSENAADWGAYISALIDAGQLSRARSVISEARASVDDSSTAEFALAEARLLSAEGNYEAVIEAGERAMEQIQTAWDEAVAAGGREAQVAQLDGLHDNYYVAALIKADAFESLGDWESAIAQYDIYIARHRGAADILIDRGNAKVEAGDPEGAEADFRGALRFMPDDAEAQEALDRIGASE